MPDGRITLDETGRLAGRGAYLCRDDACWRTALAKGGLQRALGSPLPPEMRVSLEAARGLLTTTTTMNEGGAGGQE